MEEDGSVDEIVTVFCSVRECFEPFDGAVVCCPLWVGIWWIELDFDEANAGVFMEEDESVDEIVAVFCSVREYFELYDGAVVCCPLWVGIWWIEFDFDEANAGVFMEEDKSVDEIVAVFCSVTEYFEQLQAKLCAVEEMTKVLKIVHGGVENK